MTRKPADNKTHIELDRTADDEDGCLMEEEKSKICSLKTIKALKDADQLASKSLAERKKKNKIKESESPKVPIPKAPVPEEGHAKFEKELLNLPCYHGFLPREDLVTLLRQPGDYILRSTLGNLRPSRQAKNSRTTTQTTVDASVELPAVLTTHSDKATKQKEN
ncbi:unnamed protein product [Caenorhabditis auriculariae]|uniref:SH2 domain-containing protein n=1 Tax=Caenorhabditis auriculariae TaxID=2777116 RepID=A0A8S1HIC6_9PELO|nr:unnamed protein product [Caenorhabditis auriculariae]